MKSFVLIFQMICYIFISSVYSFTPDMIEPQPIAEGMEDNGLNICLDSAHQFLFFWHWTVQDKMRNAGFRVTGSMQVLNKTLEPGRLSLMRDQVDHDFDKNLERKFLSLPNPEFNTVITYQFGTYQEYTAEERTALKDFVYSGGGLLIFGEAPTYRFEDYPAQQLVSDYGAKFLQVKTKGPWRVVDHFCTKNYPLTMDSEINLKTIDVDDNWTPLISSEKGNVILAIRRYGNGYIVLSADPYLQMQGQSAENVDIQFISDLVIWASRGKKPIGGNRRVPWEYGGVGGAIYPGNREEVAGITVCFADNQQDKVLFTIRERTQEVKQLLDRMIPSPPRAKDEFYIFPAAGAGGGWAVNVYTPRSASICCNDENTDDLLSIMAHEIAHTMTGPAASDGSANGMLPEEGQGLFSEAHAGWFQKKITAELGIKSMSHDLSDLAIIDPTLRELDLQNIPQGNTFWAWKKIWFIYSILEYQFGESFYSKWMQAIHEYCKERPKFFQLSWQESLILLSEAIGADVFPLFAAYGTEVEPPTDWDMPPIRSKVREAMENKVTNK